MLTQEDNEDQSLFSVVKQRSRNYVVVVVKKAFIGFRLSQDLKKQLEDIAVREQRSISQICEVMLRGGVDAYEREGVRYLQRILSRKLKEGPS